MNIGYAATGSKAVIFIAISVKFLSDADALPRNTIALTPTKSINSKKGTGRMTSDPKEVLHKVRTVRMRIYEFDEVISQNPCSFVQYKLLASNVTTVKR